MNKLQKNVVGIPQIIFCVISAAAPLTTMLGSVPTSIVHGNGAGIPGTYLLIGLLLITFSVGYTRMSQFVVNAGAFYSYISLGLGRNIGAGGGFIALLSYTAMQLSLYALFGFFAVNIISNFLPWYVYSLATLMLIHFLGMRNIDLNLKILGLFMILEMGILIILSIAIFIHTPHINYQSFLPKRILNHNVGIGAMFALASFIGFEATAIYSEESCRPERSIPFATYGSVCIIMIFYTLVTWAIINAYGINNVVSAAFFDPANFWFKQSNIHLGVSLTLVMRTLLLTSIFASLLAFHHTITRYIYALSRDNLLPKNLIQIHEKFHSPYRASHFQTYSTGVCVLLFALFNVPPYEVMFTWMSTLGTLGIAGLQLLVSISVILFFYKKNPNLSWSTFIAPCISTVGLGYVLLIIIANLALFSGSDHYLIYSLPMLILLTLSIGMGISIFLNRSRQFKESRGNSHVSIL